MEEQSVVAKMMAMRKRQGASIINGHRFKLSYSGRILLFFLFHFSALTLLDTKSLWTGGLGKDLLVGKEKRLTIKWPQLLG